MPPSWRTKFCTKYKKDFDILNNMNNNKYTMRYIEENRLKYKNSDSDTINCNRNNSPIYLNQNKYKNFNKSSSYLNKVNNIANINKNEKLDKHKNRSVKKKIELFRTIKSKNTLFTRAKEDLLEKYLTGIDFSKKIRSLKKLPNFKQKHYIRVSIKR